MARKKVTLAWITNDSARKVTLRKRRKGLMKKARELSTLCDAEVGVIVYGPNDPQPEVWAEPDMDRIIHKFKSMPVMEQTKKRLNLEGFIRQRISKLREKSMKVEKKNRETEMTILMNQCLAGKGLDDAKMEDLNDLAWLIDVKMKSVEERIELLKVLNVPPQEGVNEQTSLEATMKALQEQPWFMEVMNPHEPMGYVGGEMMSPFVDNSPWMDLSFPWGMM
ncbi:agamous-like MADS-box protein AGL80 [Tasmannia lanceolata]|uniref:agamous-like MADS-box protein AGL80 n=1 Tax=Tasmannia lanceolata TaxID=3420 RepID=UPI0040638F78